MGGKESAQSHDTAAVEEGDLALRDLNAVAVELNMEINQCRGKMFMKQHMQLSTKKTKLMQK